MPPFDSGPLASRVPPNPNVGASTHDTVSEALNRLENRLTDLWKGMAELEQRLHPVLRPLPPSDSVGGGNAAPVNSNVREAIQRLCNSADALSSTLSFLINRIEL